MWKPTDILVFEIRDFFLRSPLCWDTRGFLYLANPLQLKQGKVFLSGKVDVECVFIMEMAMTVLSKT